MFTTGYEERIAVYARYHWRTVTAVLHAWGVCGTAQLLTLQFGYVPYIPPHIRIHTHTYPYTPFISLLSLHTPAARVLVSVVGRSMLSVAVMR